MDSLEKIDAFLVLGRHIFKTRFCTSKRLRFFFQRKKKLWPNYQASFKSDLDFKKVKGCLRYFGQTFLLPKMKTFRDTEASFQDMTMVNSKSIFSNTPLVNISLSHAHSCAENALHHHPTRTNFLNLRKFTLVFKI